MIRMEEKVRRLLEWANGKKNFPITLELNITNKCNLKCIFCWQRGSRINYDELPLKEWRRIVREAGKIGVKEIRIPGSGEPMMRKDVVLSIVEEAHPFGMSTLLITNGTLFDERTIKRMVGRIDNVTFSIDAPNPRINDYLRGEGAFKKASKAIKEFNRWKRRLKEEKPFLRINVVITNKNHDELHMMVELAHELGCGAVSFQPMTVFSKQGEELKLSKDQLEKLPLHVEKAIEISKKYGVYTNLNEFMRVESEKSNQMDELIKGEIKGIPSPFFSSPCFEPWYNMVIMPDGSVGPCSVFGGDGENIKNKTLEEVWFGEYFDGIRKRLLSKKLFSFCKNCCVPVFEENRRLRRELLKYGNEE